MARIVAENLSVEFRIYGQSSRSLKKKILGQATGGIITHSHDAVSVKALDSLSFEFKDGDRIGLVGHNGSGKSTMLRVLAGIYLPTAGTVRVDGNVVPLLDMTSGMDYESTGLENIYLRGHLLGMKKKEIALIIDDISKFTGLGDFLRFPFKTYSAGMASRLSMAISTAVAQDILLIDENIAVGDQEFQARALERINDFKNKAKILIMANHNKAALTPYCNKIIEMKNGRFVESKTNIPNYSTKDAS